ncbi:hypothetical protein AgCh_022385 [Apium graveolens]
MCAKTGGMGRREDAGGAKENPALRESNEAELEVMKLKDKNGIWMENKEDKQHIISEYFVDLFKTESTEEHLTAREVMKQVTDEQNQKLRARGIKAWHLSRPTYIDRKEEKSGIQVLGRPSEICNRIQRQMNAFWWGGGGSSRGIKCQQQRAWILNGISVSRKRKSANIVAHTLARATYSMSGVQEWKPFFDQDPSRNFNLNPSRILGQHFNPGRRISTRIHDLDFDQDPSRTFDLDFGRNLCPSLFPGRKEFNLNPGLIYLDFDLNPGLDFDLNPEFLGVFWNVPLLGFLLWALNLTGLFVPSTSLFLLYKGMADKKMTRLAKMNVARKSSEFPIRSRYTSLIDMINTRGDEYPSDAHLDAHDHISVLRDPKELDKLGVCFKIKELFKLVLAGSADRACQWRKDALCVYRDTLRAGWKKDFLYVLLEGGDWGTLFRSSFGLAVDGSPNDIVLSEEETKAFNLLTQDNGSSHSWDLIRETVLVELAEKIEEATKTKDLETTRMKRVGKVFKDPRLGDRFPEFLL